jgi:hypothetical protein
VRTGYQHRILKNQVKYNSWRCSILRFKVIYDKIHNLNPARLNSCSSCGELLPTPAGLCPFTFAVLGFNHCSSAGGRAYVIVHIVLAERVSWVQWTISPKGTDHCLLCVHLVSPAVPKGHVLVSVIRSNYRARYIGLYSSDPLIIYRSTADMKALYK